MLVPAKDSDGLFSWQHFCLVLGGPLGQVTRKRLDLEVKIMQSNLLEHTTECVKIRILNKETKISRLLLLSKISI